MNRYQRRAGERRANLGVEPLESRDLMAPLPVLMVIADQQDFYYQEYHDTRASLEAAGVGVVVAATTAATSVPHPHSGPGWESGAVTPDITLAAADPADYSAIAFVGGWGASMYQYAYNDPSLDGVTDNFYWNSHYNGDANLGDGQIAPQKVAVNTLINQFLAADKPVAGVCHGVSVLAWARVDGVSPIAGRQIAVPLTVGSPGQWYNGSSYPAGYLMGQYEQVIDNGGIAGTVSGQYGDPTTVADDVVVDGRIITGENYNSALQFGAVIAQQVWADQPAANQAPVATDAAWDLPENAAAGTVVGAATATDPDAGQSLTFTIVGGNTGGAFAINPATGTISVANPAVIDFETNPVFTLTVRAADDGTPSLDDTAEVRITLTDVAESLPPVGMVGADLVVTGTPASDTIYLWSSGTAQKVFAWVNGTSFGPFLLPAGGRVKALGGDGNDQIYATDLWAPASINGGGGHDQITGGRGNDVLLGGAGDDRVWAGPGDDLVRGGDGNDALHGREGNDVLLGEAGHDYLDGFDGSDWLAGGTGTDKVCGGAGDDLLIGGSTGYDDDLAVLGSLRAVWVSADPLPVRVAALSAALSGGAVPDDGSPDSLCGGAGGDWLFDVGADQLFALDPDDHVSVL